MVFTRKDGDFHGRTVSLPEGTWGNRERFHNLVDSSPMSRRGVKVALQFHEAGSTAKKNIHINTASKNAHKDDQTSQPK